MLDVPEIIKQRFRQDNNSPETVRSLELSFFSQNIDTLYPSNDLYPSNSLFPADAGSPWLVIDTEHICAETLSLTESLCSGDNIIWGSCEAAKLELTVADITDEMIGKEFSAVLSIGDYQMAFGLYTVDDVVRQADRRKRKIIAYDRMVKFDVDVSEWYHSMYPTDGTVHTVSELRTSLCNHVGVPQQDTQLLNDDLTVGKTIAPEALCGRDVLKAICEINGVFGHIDRTGALVYVSLQDTGLYPAETLYPGGDVYPQSGWTSAEDLEYYKTISYEDYLIDGIDCVQIRQEEGDIGAVVGSGSNVYVIEGNFLTYGLGSADLTKLAWSVYDTIAGKTYRPAKIVSYAMPWIEAGDGLRAVTTDTEIATYVLKRTMNGIQGMMDTVESKGTKTQGQEFGLQNEIIQLKGKTAVIVRSVDEVSATVSDLEKETSAQIKVVSDQITAEVKRATGKEAELTGSISVMAGQIEQKVSQGDLIAKINLEANKSGSVITMEAGHFVFKGKNFYVNADGSGGAANGNFTWSTSGKLVAVGMELQGTANTSSIGADVINCNHLETDALNCDGDSNFLGEAQFIYISCRSIYSSVAGDSWSDKRLKRSVKPIDIETARRFITRLKPIVYKTKRAGLKGMGFYAQDVAVLQRELDVDYPLIGRKPDDGYMTLKYQHFIPLLAGALAAQQKDIEKLKEAVYGRT